MARIGAIVLAAGASTRMGRPKSLLRLRGETLVARAVRATRDGGCAPVVVVVAGDSSSGWGDPAIPSQARARGAEVVANPGWSEGVASSIRAGLAAVEGDPSIGGILILAVDQPFVEPEDVARLIEGSEGGEAVAAADHGNGVAGIPAIFPRRHFPTLGRLRGDAGARAIIEAEKDAARRVPMPSAAIDVDSPEDCRRRGIDAD
jgi:CTP:molybdopterin cytidylyltransferase MocA